MLVISSLLLILCCASFAYSAECALVLTSPQDGAVFTTTADITIYGYAEADVDPGSAYVEVRNNDQYVWGANGTFTQANQVLESPLKVLF